MARNDQSFPIAEAIHREVVSLPISSLVSLKGIITVVEAVSGYV